MQKQEFKKSAVDLTDLAIGIIVLGIAVSIGATILLNYRDSRVTSLDTANIVNETATENKCHRWNRNTPTEQ